MTDKYNYMVFRSCDDLTIYSITIYGEARGEGIEGMLAVASVVANRAKISKKTIKSVCLRPMQFSCFNPKDPNREVLESIVLDWNNQIQNNKFLRQAYWVAKGMIEGYLMSNVGNATHYHNIACKPDWADRMEKITRIGKHQFYFERGWK